MKMFVVAMGALFAVSACGKKDEGAAAAGAASGLPASCTKLISQMKTCLDKAGPAGDAVKSAFAEAEKQYAEAAKAGPEAIKVVDEQCTAQLKTVKDQLGALCPDVSFD